MANTLSSLSPREHPPAKEIDDNLETSSGLTEYIQEVVKVAEYY